MGYILITGASGFIGKNLLGFIAEHSPGSENKVLVLGSSELPNYPVIRHRDYQFSSSDFKKRGFNDIETVIHLGAFTPKSPDEANLYDENISNVINTHHLLNNLPNRPDKFIFSSSIDVYQKDQDIISEHTPAVPSSFYGQCKLFCENMVLNWCHLYSVKPQILRIGHIYGYGEEAYRKLIPETIRRVRKNENPVIYTKGNEKRSFLHVNDCVRAIWSATTLDEYTGPFNIASSRSYTVKQIVDKIIAISGKKLSPEVLNNNLDTRDWIFNNDRMLQYLGGELVEIDAGLENEYAAFSED